MERNIRVSNMPEKGGIEKLALMNLIEKRYDRLAAILPEGLALEIHFKGTHGQGKREQIEVHAKAVAQGVGLHSSFMEWDAEKALKEALDALDKEAKKALGKKK